MSNTEYPGTQQEVIDLMGEATALIERIGGLLKEVKGGDDGPAHLAFTIGTLFSPVAESCALFPESDRVIWAVIWGYTLGFAYARVQAEAALSGSN